MFEVIAIGTASAMPTPSRGLPCIALRKDGSVFLFDCGEGSQRQMMLFGVSYMKVKAIFISHLHLDHYLGVFGLLETMRLNGRKEKLYIYAPKGASCVFGRNALAEVVEIDAGWKGDFGGFSVSAFAVKHWGCAFGFSAEEKEKVRFYEQKAKALGIRGPMFSEIQKKGHLLVGGRRVGLEEVTYRQKGKKVVFSGDTSPCAELAKAAHCADLLIHEATFAKDRAEEAEETLHSTAEDAAKCAKKAKASCLMLTHFSGRYADASKLLEEARAIFKNTIAAEDGMKVSV